MGTDEDKKSPIFYLSADFHISGYVCVCVYTYVRDSVCTSWSKGRFNELKLKLEVTTAKKSM